MKPTNKIVIVLIAVFLTVAIWLCFDWWKFLKTPLIATNQKPVNFVFVQGMSAKKAAIALCQQDLIKQPLFFSILARLKGVEYNLKAGEYNIEPGITPSQLLQKMANGEAIHHAFTIVEGWTFSQLITALNNNPYVKHTIQKLTNDGIMEQINHPGELPEGRFAPDTYLFSGNVKDTDILCSAYKLMQKRLQKAWDNRDLNPPYHYHCPYEALIVASLIEKETACEKEKPIIAGVILQRLAKDRLLQVDPTIIYGLGVKYKGKLTKNDYKKDGSYNTYTRKGLPPTPIAMPGNSSIIAALHPSITNALYYAAKGDGTHEFSPTFKEQNKAVKKYLTPRKRKK
jgi:UPF0755 protein